MIITSLKKSRHEFRRANRDLVLAAARQVLLRDGSFRFSLRAVARELRCSPGTIYNYYTDKDDLISAATEASFMRLRARLRSVRNNTGSIADRVRQMGEIYVRFGLANQEDYAIAFTVPVASSSSKLDKPHEAYFLAERMIADAVKAGELVGSPSEIIQVIWMGLHGLVSLLIQRPNFPWAARRRLVAAVLDSVVGSLPLKPSQRIASCSRTGTQL